MMLSEDSCLLSGEYLGLQISHEFPGDSSRDLFTPLVEGNHLKGSREFTIPKNRSRELAELPGFLLSFRTTTCLIPLSNQLTCST